jgi:hypothetical protein
MAPITRPKPQLIQHAIALITVTIRIACPGVFAVLASIAKHFLKTGAPAIAWPVTTTIDIYIEKVSRFQKPPDQASMIWFGLCPVIGITKTNTARVSRAAKIKGSGR